eukprot:2781817-Prymnesium_polylepis.3
MQPQLAALVVESRSTTLQYRARAAAGEHDAVLRAAPSNASHRARRDRGALEPTRFNSGRGAATSWCTAVRDGQQTAVRLL